MSGAKRSAYVDMVKGIAIIVVVIIHLLAPCAVKNVFLHITEMLVYAFFFYAGFFYSPGKRTIREGLKARFKSLMVPFFAYSLVFWAVGTVYMLIAKIETGMEALCCLRNFYGGCIWNRVIQNKFEWEYYSLGGRYPFLADFWFFLALMMAYIIFIPLGEYVLRKKPVALITALLMFALTGVLRAKAVDLPYNLQLIPFWVGLMMLGALSRPLKLMELPFMSGIKGWLISLATIAGSVAAAMMKDPVSNVFRGNFGDEGEVRAMIISLLISLVFIWGLSNLCRLIEESGIRVKELTKVGTLSLYFFVYHMFFGWILSIIFKVSLKFDGEITTEILLKSIVILVISFTLSVLAGLATEKIKMRYSTVCRMRRDRSVKLTQKT